MIGQLLANGPTYFVIFVAALSVAAGFGFVLLRGLHTGVMPLGRGLVIYRERQPVAFRAAAVVHALIVVGMAATPFYIVWKQSGGH